MIRDGFVAESAPDPGSVYTPHPQWNGKLEDEWVFHYTRRALVAASSWRPVGMAGLGPSALAIVPHAVGPIRLESAS